MTNEQGYLNSFTTGRVTPATIEHGMRKGRRLRAEAIRSIFGKVRHQLSAR